MFALITFGPPKTRPPAGWPGTWPSCPPHAAGQHGRGHPEIPPVRHDRLISRTLSYTLVTGMLVASMRASSPSPPGSCRSPPPSGWPPPPWPSPRCSAPSGAPSSGRSTGPVRRRDDRGGICGAAEETPWTWTGMTWRASWRRPSSPLTCRYGSADAAEGGCRPPAHTLSRYLRGGLEGRFLRRPSRHSSVGGTG